MTNPKQLINNNDGGNNNKTNKNSGSTATPKDQNNHRTTTTTVTTTTTTTTKHVQTRSQNTDLSTQRPLSGVETTYTSGNCMSLWARKTGDKPPPPQKKGTKGKTKTKTHPSPQNECYSDVRWPFRPPHLNLDFIEKQNQRQGRALVRRNKSTIQMKQWNRITPKPHLQPK